MDIDRVGQVAEGKIRDFKDESFIKPEELKVFSVDDYTQQIKIETREFSAVCPFSGLPDIAYILIEYRPVKGLALELKALKYYFLSFRDVGLYQEGVTSRIYQDLYKILKYEYAGSLKVTSVYNTRGGIDTTCSCGHLDEL